MNTTARVLDLSEATRSPWPFNNVQRFPLPEDTDQRVARTAAAMAAFTHHAAAVGPSVAQLARVVANDRPASVPVLVALWQFLKSGQDHQDDPPGKELLRHPEQSAQAMRTGKFAGDCDDVAMLAAAVLVRLGGYAVAFRVIAREGRDWEHVYTVAAPAGYPLWAAIDPQETDTPLAERAHARAWDFPVWSVA